MNKNQITEPMTKWSEYFEYASTMCPPGWYYWFVRMGDAVTKMMNVFSNAPSRTIKRLQVRKELKAELEAQREINKATNDAMVKLKGELEFTHENLKSIQAKLVQSDKMATVGILTAGIAHELNNPINFVSSSVKPLQLDIDDLLSIIQKYDEIVKSKKIEDAFAAVNELKGEMDFSFMTTEIHNLIKGIEDGSNRSSQIVKGLSTFSRKGEDLRQSYNIHEGIDSSLLILHNKIKNKIKVRKEYGDFKELECYPNKLNQVIMNALTNSIQAIEDHGEICIQTFSCESEVKIIIKDNGKGMTPEVQKRIFEPFYTTKKMGEGTGLGLSISFEIIEQHNGKIDVRSESGKGTEFIISLPRTRSK